MKKLIIPIIAITIVSTSALTGCKQAQRITTEQIQAIEDSIPNLFPTVKMIHTNQNEDNDQVNIIVGDVPFYSSTQEQKQAAAVRTGAMLLHVLGPNNNISTATLVITKDMRNNDGIPSDGIKADMKIDSLRKAGVK